MKKRTLLLLAFGAILGISGITYFNPMFYNGTENIELLQSTNRTSMKDILMSNRLDSKDVLISFWKLKSQKCLYENEIEEKYLSENYELLHLIEVDGLIDRNQALKLIKSKNLRGKYLLILAEPYTKLLLELHSTRNQVGAINVFPVQYLIPANPALTNL